MKRIFLLCSYVLVLLAAHAQTPIAYYPFNANANDAISTNNGTVNGATLTADRFGNANSAYSFDGADDNISIGNNAVFNFTNYSISVWFKYNGEGTAGKSIWSLISKNSNGNGFDDAFHIWIVAADKTTGGRVGNGATEFYVSNLPAIDNGSWHHSVLVFDNANDAVKLFLDGILISSVANTSNPFNNGSPIKIGFWEAFNNFFNGAIDEVKTYNTALTNAQVLHEYITTSSQINTGIIAGGSFCPGSVVSVPFTFDGTANAGNVFTAELSDAAGSFAAPVNIGTLAAINGGAINAVIPFAQAAGTQYRIRVTASDPASIGTDNGSDIIITAPNSPLSVHTKEWIGGTGNWDNPTNWLPCGLPNGFSVIQIKNGDNVTLPTGFSANSLRVEIDNGGQLTIQNAATLNCDGSPLNGFYIQDAGSSLTNNGTINIGNFVAVNGHGIVVENGATLTNAAGATININNITGSLISEGAGIYTEAASVTNAGTINIGSTTAISRFGIVLKANAQFNNQTTAVIEVNRIAAFSGIQVTDAGSVFTNAGIIKAGNIASINSVAIFLQSGSQFINTVTGSLEVNRTIAGDGIRLENANTSFSNAGAIVIGNLAAISFSGITSLSGSQFTNQPGGTIELNNTPNANGLALGDAGTQFINNGAINIGNLSAIKSAGISLISSASFINNSAASVNINNVNGALSSQGFGLNIDNAAFTNNGLLNIGNTTAINRFGISVTNGGQLSNPIGATININRVTTVDGISAAGTGTAITNGGTIRVGNAAVVFRIGIAMFTAAQFTNQSTGLVEVSNITGASAGDGISLSDAGTVFTNNGTVNCGVAGLPIRRIGISLFTTASFINNTGATVNINNITSATSGEGFGIAISGGTFNNSGTAGIGTTTAISRIGIFISAAGLLNNLSGANLRINRITTLDAIQATGTGTTISNSGNIKIGEVSAILNSGITLLGAAQLTNQTSGLIEINNITNSDGLVLGSAGAAVINNGTVNIGNLFAVKRIGVFVNPGTTLTNSITGVITINNITGTTTSQGYGFYATGVGAVCSNSGSINIGNTTSISRIGMFVATSAQLTNQTSGTIQINRINLLAAVQMQSSGKIFNNGIFHIGNTNSIDEEGILIFSASEFANNSTGILSINRNVSFDGIYVNGTNSKFINSGTATIGNLATITVNGIGAEAGGGVINNSTGVLEISNAGQDGVYLSGTNTSFTNNGSLKIGLPGAIVGYGINLASTATFTNANAASVEINNIANFGNGGINVSGATFNNSGLLKIGNTAQVYARGLDLKSAGVFNNLATGQLEISRTNISGSFGAITIAGTNTTLNNAGSIKIGVVPNSTFHGIVMSGSCIFNNQAGSILDINNLGASGVAINYTSGAFTNAGNISIGTSGSSIHRGIDRFLAFGSISNTGTITFGNITNYGIGGATNLQNNSAGVLQTAPSGVLRIDGTVTNNTGASVLSAANSFIMVWGTLINNAGGTVTNHTTAALSIDYSSLFSNAGTFTNNGLLTATGPMSVTASTLRNTGLVVNNGTVSLLHADGRIENNAGATFTNNGTIKGVGTIIQNAAFNNTTGSFIQPGLSPGTLTVTGDFDLGNATLQMEVNGITAGTYDLLNISGNATLTNAILNVTTGFTPVIGQSVTIQKSAALAGIFASTVTPGWVVTYNDPLTGDVTLTYTGTLPLTLLSFTGNKQSNDAVLHWKTANEINVSRFEILRSYDGVNFTAMGTVSAGTTSYSYTDAGIFNNRSIVFYRLKSIDIDGRFTLSAIIKLSNKQINPLTVYPNPAKNIITISSSKKQDAVIINAAGIITGRLQLINGSITVDVAAWAAGIYFIKTDDELFKLIKQ